MFPMNVDFYLNFEERYRGSRDVIKSRLQVYRPFVEELRRLHQDLLVVDLGCGRGEWLELLKDQGITALGIDLDDQMLSACRERDLRVETADALTWLAEQPNESCDIVSAFHLVEHLPFAGLDQLVHHGLRVLRTGGLLILETPNPENIVVGTANFYLDPTHQRPLPPPLLAFLPEYHGFARTKIMRLQESAELAAGKEPTLFDVLGGVSPDYAVIAQKQGEAHLLAPFDALWEREYGVKTDTLAMRYEQAHQQAMRSALELARQAVEKSDILFRQQQQQTETYRQQLVAQQQQADTYRQQLEAMEAIISVTAGA
jgi:O-antigen chain-terminating methyltransferase